MAFRNKQRTTTNKTYMRFVLVLQGFILKKKTKQKTQLFWIWVLQIQSTQTYPYTENTDMPLSWSRPMEMLMLLYLTPKAWVGTEENWQSCWLSLCRSKTHRCQTLNAKQTEREREGCEGGCSSLKIHRAWHSLGYIRLSSFFMLSYFFLFLKTELARK